ncbi:MAG: hypothetical protein QHH07_11795, partial [Sedimentisphaerales bacterium]|nr:hypothetical protein [Sedimentisphaerales bacterium]
AWPVWLAAWSLILVSGLLKAVMRQHVASRLISGPARRIRQAAILDLLGFWLWPPVMLGLIASSAIGTTVDWRGMRYKVYSSNRIEVLTDTYNRAATG